MKRILTVLIFPFILSTNFFGQSIDSLKLSDKEIPEGYSISKENNCISIQACSFYDSPDIYEMLIGKIKNKTFQSFESKKDKGSIMYFEFEDGFKGDSFLGSLLWGGNKPTKEHPEQIFSKGNFLIIWSFKKGSPIMKVSQDKIKAILK
jgi:hypothetical protein